MMTMRLMSLSFKPISLQQNRNITQIKLILPQSKYYNNINVILNRLGFSIHSPFLFLLHILHWIGFICPRAHKWKTGTDYTVCLLCNSGTVFLVYRRIHFHFAELYTNWAFNGANDVDNCKMEIAAQNMNNKLLEMRKWTKTSCELQIFR